MKNNQLCGISVEAIYSTLYLLSFSKILSIVVIQQYIYNSIVFNKFFFICKVTYAFCFYAGLFSQISSL